MAKNKKAEKPDGEPEMAPETSEPQPVSPHVDDQRARPYIVHLPPTKRPGRREVRLDVRDVGAFTFRRGAGGDLEHVIRLTPPAARQLRTEGWIVLEKE
jgi:hypothetical protein